MNDEAAGGAPDWRVRRRQLQDAVERHMIRYIGDFPPFFVERAEGSYFFDDRGRRILDFTSGQMCATLGHNHPAVVAAIARRCERALHLFSWLLAPEVVELCRELAALLPPQLQKVMLLNTGSEANEAALRMAKLATGRHEVSGLSNSFHGLTGGAGWIAVALVIFAFWRPDLCLVGAYLFGAFSALPSTLQARGWLTSIPSEVFSSLPYVMTIVVLVAVASGAAKRRLGAPAALGVPYVREER